MASPTLREIPKSEWWDWDVSVEFPSVASPDDADLTEVRVESLKDNPDLRAELAKRIEQADELGNRFIPDPMSEGLIEISERLRTAITSAEVLADNSDEQGRLKRSPKQVLQVLENWESIAFDPELGCTDVDVPTLPAPASLQAPYSLYPHQHEGYEWLSALNRKKYNESHEGNVWRGALLADDMGVGKTIQVLAHLARLTELNRDKPHLVVAPVGLIGNWQDEAHKFFGAMFEPMMHFTTRTGATGNVEASVARLSAHKLVFVSYETLRRNESVFAKVEWDTVILDEAQKAKNPQAQVTRALKTLKARFRLAMTGTPVENTLAELFTIVDWALPQLLGSLKEFNQQFIKPARDPSHNVRVELSEKLRGRLGQSYKRRMKQDVLAGLPKISDLQRISVPMSAEQEASYSELQSVLFEQPRKRLGGVIRLLGICAHPLMTQGGFLPSLDEHPFPKGLALFKLLDQIKGRDEKAIIFANRRLIQQWLKEECQTRYGLPVSVINGQVNDSRKRVKLIDEFSKREGFGVIVLSAKAAGVGLNITAANHVIHYTREWNPAIENQATDRAYRIGQTRPVHLYTFVATSQSGRTVDEVLDQRLEDKRQLMRDFVVPVGGGSINEQDLWDAMAEGSQ